MTTVKAQNRFDEVVTQEVLEKAIKRGSQRVDTGVHAQQVQYLLH